MKKNEYEQIIKKMNSCAKETIHKFGKEIDRWDIPEILKEKYKQEGENFLNGLHDKFLKMAHMSFKREGLSPIQKIIKEENSNNSNNILEATRKSEDFENGFDEQERQMESENEMMEDSFLDNFD